MVELHTWTFLLGWAIGAVQVFGFYKMFRSK